MRPKTITIHLPNGEPAGIKIAELSNRIIRAYVIPRELLSDARSTAELSKPALYLLLSKDGEQAYVGESENFLARMRTHDMDSGKDYWDLVIAFVAKDSSLEKGDVGYLESIAVAQAQEAKKTELHNKTVPSKNNLHPFKISTVEEFFEDVCLLSAALGFPIFDVLKEEEIRQSEIWYCKTNKTDARGVFDGGSFTVLAGSAIDIHHAESLERDFPGVIQQRKEIFASQGAEKDGVIVLSSNVNFKSPNQAGVFAAGRTVNAWTTWKNEEGKTMDEVLR